MNLAIKKRFTLVELLLVMAIIAIIASIILPVMYSAKQSARGVACFSNMRQMGMAITMYRSDYRDMFGYNYPPWISRLYPVYIGSKNLSVCPCDPKKGGRSQLSYSETMYSYAFDKPGNFGLYGESKPSTDFNNPNPNVPHVSYMYDFNQGAYQWYNTQNSLTGTKRKSWCQAKQDFITGNNIYGTDKDVDRNGVNDTAKDFFARENWAKRLSYVPVVRCFWHLINKKKNDPIRNLSVNGNIFYSNGKWETNGVWNRGEY